jgi:hypothetical protein
MIRHFLAAVLYASLLGLWAPDAPAQVIYKSTMPDGRVIYGNEPAPGAKKVESMTPRTDDTGVRSSTPAQDQALQRRMSERDQRNAQQSELAELEKAVKAAEAAQAAGREPIEGERVGTAGGYSRLTDAYWERQQQLEQAVQEARKRLEQARAGR